MDEEAHEFVKWLEAERAQTANEALERAARVCEELVYPIHIDKWNKMTKKDHGAYGCQQCAAAIRALKT